MNYLVFEGVSKSYTNLQRFYFQKRGFEKGTAIISIIIEMSDF